MKILWFTNSSCSLSKKYNSKSFSGGWMVSLENKLNKIPEVELFISFYNYELTNSVIFNGTTYFPVLKEENICSKIKQRVFNQFKVEPKEINRLLEVVKEINPDIIHIHGTEMNFGLIQKFVSKPVVISIQGIINPYNEKYFSGIPKEEVKKHESVKYKMSPNSQIKKYFRFKSIAKNEQEILNISKHIIGRTTWDRRVTSLLSPNGKYYHVDELLRDDFKNYVWNNNNHSADDFKIITIASGPIYKGLETIIKTVLFLHQISGLKFSWDIVGLFENDAVVKLIVAWMKIDLSKINLFFQGKLLPEKFIPLMLNSDIYCQASHIENSPNSLCEAMYLGMPIVATFAGGTESILENNKEGILIQDGDPYSMAGALLEIKNNPIKAKEMGKHARKRALARHDPDKVVGDLFKVYKEVIAKNN